MPIDGDSLSTRKLKMVAWLNYETETIKKKRMHFEFTIRHQHQKLDYWKRRHGQRTKKKEKNILKGINPNNKSTYQIFMKINKVIKRFLVKFLYFMNIFLGWMNHLAAEASLNDSIPSWSFVPVTGYILNCHWSLTEQYT